MDTPNDTTMAFTVNTQYDSRIVINDISEEYGSPIKLSFVAEYHDGNVYKKEAASSELEILMDAKNLRDLAWVLNRYADNLEKVTPVS